jgi:hypothetical protein
MWEYVPKEMGDEREKALMRDVWKDMLHDGCSVERFQDTYESAWDIVKRVTRKDSGTPFLIQEEMGVAGKPLNETTAVRNLKPATEETVHFLLRRLYKGFRR